jgi:hypothetical protein
MGDIPWAALSPLIVFVGAFVVYCLVDISRNEVRHLPKWGWAVVCLISIPFGGIAYLLLGRDVARNR